MSNAMSNMKSNSDALSLVRDNDLGQIIRELDRMYVGLSDLEAAPALIDEPAIQQELHRFSKVTRTAADLFVRFREEIRR